MAVLDIFLGVVPGPSSRRHGDGDEEAGDDDAEQHGAERREGRALPRNPIDDEIEDYWRQYRQQRGYDHLLDRRAGEEIDRLAVVGPVGALHDAGLLLELAAHLLDDGRGRAPDRRHCDTAEEIR